MRYRIDWIDGTRWISCDDIKKLEWIVKAFEFDGYKLKIQTADQIRPLKIQDDCDSYS